MTLADKSFLPNWEADDKVIWSLVHIFCYMYQTKKVVVF